MDVLRWCIAQERGRKSKSVVLVGSVRLAYVRPQASVLDIHPISAMSLSGAGGGARQQSQVGGKSPHPVMAAGEFAYAGCTSF